MDAEGIREIARMQQTIDDYRIGMQYLVLQLSHPTRHFLFPEIDIPELSFCKEEIDKLLGHTKNDE